MVYNAGTTERSKQKIPAAERRMLILEILSVRRFTTVGNLVYEFGVCRKTIQNDKGKQHHPGGQGHGGAGLPVHGAQGKGGGIHVVPGWKEDRLYLTSEQENVLIRLIQTLPKADGAVLQSIVSTFAKPRKE